MNPNEALAIDDLNLKYDGNTLFAYDQGTVVLGDPWLYGTERTFDGFANVTAIPPNDTTPILKCYFMWFATKKFPCDTNTVNHPAESKIAKLMPVDSKNNSTFECNEFWDSGGDDVTYTGDSKWYYDNGVWRIVACRINNLGRYGSTNTAYSITLKNYIVGHNIPEPSQGHLQEEQTIRPLVTVEGNLWITKTDRTRPSNPQIDLTPPNIFGVEYNVLPRG